MIPTMILFGALFGWWWKFTVVVAPVFWVILLLVGVPVDWSRPGEVVGATLPQAIRLVRYLLRRARRTTPSVVVRY